MFAMALQSYVDQAYRQLKVGLNTKTNLFAKKPVNQRGSSTYITLSNDKEMVINSFDECSITTKGPMKVRIGLFYEECMANTKSMLEDETVEEAEDNPFNL